MMDKVPIVTVLMPVFNTAQYVGQAIESILDQTFTDFEFIIIDDASTDGSVEVIRQFADPRIQLIVKPVNTGYTASLNMGLKIARGTYIARMDSDDISLPFRLEKQVNFMDMHPSVIVYGSSYMILGTNEIIGHPDHPDDVKIYLLSGCYVAHPSVMLRFSTMQLHQLYYDIAYEPAEDYNLWIEMTKWGEIANSKEPLIHYRVHTSQTSSQRLLLQLQQADVARLKLVGYLFEPQLLTEDQKNLHLALMKTDLGSPFTLEEMQVWRDALKQRNAARHLFQEKRFSDFLDLKVRTFVRNYFLVKSFYTANLLILLFNTRNKYYRNFTIAEVGKILIKWMIKKVPTK